MLPNTARARSRTSISSHRSAFGGAAPAANAAPTHASARATGERRRRPRRATSGQLSSSRKDGSTPAAASTGTGRRPSAKPRPAAAPRPAPAQWARCSSSGGALGTPRSTTVSSRRTSAPRSARFCHTAAPAPAALHLRCRRRRRHPHIRFLVDHLVSRRHARHSQRSRSCGCHEAHDRPGQRKRQPQRGRRRRTSGGLL
ncbi:unnamed protein product [Prorocentrum cordatum]|uniref:Uncharacterized protein n=1 Tax=Prorocentrum cordatum TaxID=2364126 RepID=A0ABN9RBK9_9DINO|nr:unnamed protein product [Polarella glacialis]